MVAAGGRAGEFRPFTPGSMRILRFRLWKNRLTDRRRSAKSAEIRVLFENPLGLAPRGRAPDEFCVIDRF
ncbi:MAG: hypothetical protein DWQ45_25845 [Planctomycetota bacterium]|nr:MAG: hypothetical protein DWQ29_05375 [Planctomycetota bacterium]REK27509.1 MAG: hypothetical protein DWQ45_25845 [Planctomycetota bacterium]